MFAACPCQTLSGGGGAVGIYVPAGFAVTDINGRVIAVGPTTVAALYGGSVVRYDGGKIISTTPAPATGDGMATIQPYGPSVPIIDSGDRVTTQVEPIFTVIQGEASDTPAGPVDNYVATPAPDQSANVPWGLILGALALLAN